MNIFNSIKRLVVATAFAVVATSSAHAVPVTVVDYSGAGNPGVEAEITAGGTFQTAGAAAVASFLNWANFLPLSDAVGKVKISGVTLTGAASALGPNVYMQSTTGGRIEVLDAVNTLLLSVDFTSGLLTLATTGAGGQFTTGVATFGGAFASYFQPSTAAHSISLINWTPVQLVAGANGLTFGASAGYGNGLISGEQVPEPATMFLLGSGILGAALRRRSVA